ncbi:UNVERIFIED_CONTAM: ABC-2 family transporter [Acetivibrio alkalicellulosi]
MYFYQIFVLSKKIINLFFSNILLLFGIVVLHFVQLINFRNVYNNFVGEYSGVLTGLCQTIILDGQDKVDPLNFYSSTILVQLIFICGIIAASFVCYDKEKNTLTRMLVAPVRKAQILIGYLLGFVFSIMIISGIYIIISTVVLGVYWGNSLYNLILINIICTVLSVSLSLLLSTFFNNTKLAAGVMSILLIIMSFLSGSVTATVQYSKTSNFTLLKWAFEAYVNNMEDRLLSESFINITIMCSLSIVFLILSSLFFWRRSIYDN